MLYYDKWEHFAELFLKLTKYSYFHYYSIHTYKIFKSSSNKYVKNSL